MNIKRVIENQNEIYNMLKRAKDSDHLSHAYLFYGQKGTGKKEMAYALSMMLYCPNDVCLKCDECRSIINGTNLNVIYVAKEENKTVISKEQINNLQEEFSKTSLANGVRIYIVDGIDDASVNAQNSLLKFIEEPENSENTIGIFIATELSNVISTIQSRCELVYFKEIDKKTLIKNLCEEGFEELDASLIASLTNNIDIAVDIYNSFEYQKSKEMFLDLLNTKTKADGVVFTFKYQNNNDKEIKSKDLLNDPKIVEMLCNFIIVFYEDALFHYKNNEDLILKSLCDKIKEYRQHKKNIKHRLSGTLNSFDKLRYNIAPKNVFFEAMIFFLE